MYVGRADILQLGSVKFMARVNIVTDRNTSCFIFNKNFVYIFPRNKKNMKKFISSSSHYLKLIFEQVDEPTARNETIEYFILSSSHYLKLIFAQLDYESTFPVALVCKQWRSEIQRIKFSPKYIFEPCFNKKLLKWCILFQCPLEKIAISAVKHKHIETLEYLNILGMQFSLNSSYKLLEDGLIDIWVNHWQKKGNIVDKKHFALLAQTGDLDLLKYIYSTYNKERKRFFPNAYSTSLAAGAGHLDVLIWLKHINCPFNDWSVIRAREGKHDNVIKWLENNREELMLQID